MRLPRMVAVLFLSALALTLTASGVAGDSESGVPTSDYPAESTAPLADHRRESVRIRNLFAGLLPLMQGATEEVPASPFVPPGKPGDRPPDPPGQNDPPNPPGKPDDRPPGHSQGDT